MLHAPVPWALHKGRNCKCVCTWQRVFQNVWKGIHTYYQRIARCAAHLLSFTPPHSDSADTEWPSNTSDLCWETWGLSKNISNTLLDTGHEKKTGCEKRTLMRSHELLIEFWWIWPPPLWHFMFVLHIMVMYCQKKTEVKTTEKDAWYNMMCKKKRAMEK